MRAPDPLPLPQVVPTAHHHARVGGAQPRLLGGDDAVGGGGGPGPGRRAARAEPSSPGDAAAAERRRVGGLGDRLGVLMDGVHVATFCCLSLFKAGSVKRGEVSFCFFCSSVFL